jgi:hypothetical protein
MSARAFGKGRLRDTLALILLGCSEKEIAQRLSISPHTVHVHIKTLYRRFAIASRAALTATLIFEYILEPDPQTQSPSTGKEPQCQSKCAGTW